jgi:hypothetical protein
VRAPTAPATSVRVHGRELAPGTEVSITGERGRFRFIRAHTTSTGQTVLDFIGGPDGHPAFRSFYPERIKTVHRINRTRHAKTSHDKSRRVPSPLRHKGRRG